MENSPAERLIAHWLVKGISFRPGVAASELAAFERRHAVALPKDLRKFLLTTNCQGRWQGGDEFISCFWSLEDYMPLDAAYPDGILDDRRNALPNPGAWFLFADMMIEAPCYAIRLTADAAAPSPVAALWCDMPLKANVTPVAESFTTFIDEYLKHGMLPS